MDGQPLAKAIVDFQPDGGDERSSYDGQTDEAGHYVLHATASPKGSRTRRLHRPHYPAEVGRRRSQREDRAKLPAKYNTQSELKATVKDGKNTFDWPLTSN